MPIVLRQGPYRFYFFSHVPNEPPHIHVDRDLDSAKLWLEPVRLARDRPFRAHELTVIEREICINLNRLLEAWYERHGDRG